MKKWMLLFLLPITLSAHEVLSFGNAIIDHIVFVDDDFIEGRKGGSFHVEYEEFQKLIGDAPIVSAGGSAPNTMKGLALLGHDCAVIGRIGKDLEGALYAESLLNYGVTPRFTPFPFPTGRVVCMIEPNGKRTMRSHLGNFREFPSFPLVEEDFKGIQLFHIEGYQIHNLPLLKKMIALAKKEGALVSMDMGCFQLVEQYKERILDLIENDLDIVFANQLEANELTGLEPIQACEKLSTLCPIAVVTHGPQGGYVGTEGTFLHYPAILAEQIDDTGAGDLFIAGFLHGILEGAPFKECARNGAELASQIVQRIGTELPLGKQAHVGNDHEVGIDLVPEDISDGIQCSASR